MIHATLEDTVYFWFAANDTSGSGSDGASPVYDVRLAGAAADAIPTLSGSGTLLIHANYPAGCHEVAVAATNANGFAANATYGVFCTLLVDSQNPTGFIGSFKLGPIVSNSIQVSGTSQTANDNGADINSILALLDDARGEPAQGAPPVNPDMATKIDWLYKIFRNKITSTASQISVYNDAGAVVDHKSTISDVAGTFTRGEFETGP